MLWIVLVARAGSLTFPGIPSTFPGIPSRRRLLSWAGGNGTQCTSTYDTERRSARWSEVMGRGVRLPAGFPCADYEGCESSR